MHELGIVFHIIRTVEDVARQNDVTRIRRVTLQLGEVSGVVESYLQDCWKWAAAKSELLPGAVLTVETIPAVTVCEEDPFPTRLLQAGAAGYMTKGAGLAEMVQAIRLVFAGQRYISPQVAQQLALKSFQPASDSPTL